MIHSAYLAKACLWRCANRPQQVGLLGASKAALLHTVIQSLGEDTAEAGMPRAGSPGGRAGRQWPGCRLSGPAAAPVPQVQGAGTLLTKKAVWLQPFEECSKYLQNERRLAAEPSLQKQVTLGPEKAMDKP